MINYIIGGLILLTVILAIARIHRDRKNGSCCGGCSGCSSAGQCSAYRDLETQLKEKSL